MFPLISGQTERKISFVLHEPDNESEGSSNTTLTVHGEENNTPTSGKILSPVFYLIDIVNLKIFYWFVRKNFRNSTA